MRNDWFNDELRILEAGIACGCTSAEIAAQLRHRHSRFSVIGKARQLGLKWPNSKPVERTTKKPAQRRPNPVRQPAPVAIVRMSEEPEFVGPVGAFPDDPAASPRTCRAIAGDPGLTEWRCCGQPTVVATAYCDWHLRKFVQPSTFRRSA